MIEEEIYGKINMRYTHLHNIFSHIIYFYFEYYTNLGK